MIEAADALVRAVLYEGYALYPYRPSALKNQRRFAFGAVYPRAWAERALEPERVRAEVVARAPAAAMVAVHVRFLRLARGGGASEEALALAPITLADGAARCELFARGDLTIEVASEVTVDGALWRIAIEVRNTSELEAGADHEAAMDRATASTHVVLELTGGDFVSLIDPPADAADAVASCRCTGLYPILVGANAMLASPIILPDHPQLAPQSPGDFFDGTEMDEMLTLRVLTMTDDEKREAAAADPRIAQLLARTASLGVEATAQLHGVVHTSWPRRGTRVRLRPSRRADAFDGLLAGKLGTVAAIERDLDGAIHCAVTLDDDPGADLGDAGMPGHRFFFRADELEVLT